MLRGYDNFHYRVSDKEITLIKSKNRKSKISSSKEKKKLRVCYCCQFFFRASMNFHINSKDVRCGNPHFSQQCTAQLSISTKIPPKSAN